MDKEKGQRLNKVIASQLHLGRRAADILIASGKVRLNDQVPPLGARLHEGDRVTVNGQVLASALPKFLYVLMNKPIGYVCSRRQQGDTPTIYQLLPAKYQHLKTVGRLDKDSSGLLLLTNDGQLAHSLMHPGFNKIKQYEVTLDTPLQPLHHQMINDFGVQLPDGQSKFQLERIKGDSRWLVTMREGRNRQIRRTFAALGYTVTKLHRTHFGPFSLAALDGKPLKEIPRPQ